MKLPQIDPVLDKRLREFAKQVQVKFGYPAELAYKVAYNGARFHWDIVVADGVARKIRPTKADGRVAS